MHKSSLASPLLSACRILVGIKKLATCGLLMCFVPLGVVSQELPQNITPIQIARALNQAFVGVADEVSPSVVVIRVAQKPGAAIDELDESYFDMLPPELREPYKDYFKKAEPQEPAQEPSRSRPPVFDGQGSGVIIRPEGYILTSNHVVENAEMVKVILLNGEEYPAEVIGLDPDSDLAVIQIQAPNLKVAKLGDSNLTKVGEFSIAIGAPFDLDYSVTFGHISAKGRRVFSDFVMMDQNFIQTDANINPGNSGGPLVNIEGEVIGINALIRGMSTGIGFAVPINLASKVADQLIEYGKVRRTWLGVGISDLTEAYKSRFLGFAPDLRDGVVITEILADGPAAKSDLRRGSIITRVDGVRVRNVQELKSEIRARSIGQILKLDVEYRGESKVVDVEAGEFPREVSLARLYERSPQNSERAGLLVETFIPSRNLSEDLYELWKNGDLKGLVVKKVLESASDSIQQIQPGDLILEVNGKKVETLLEFEKAFDENSNEAGASVFILTTKAEEKFIAIPAEALKEQ
jgi:serine protease Do